MESVTIKIWVSQAVAIEHACPHYGTVEYSTTTDELQSLSPDQRKALVEIIQSHRLPDSQVAPVVWSEVVRILQAEVDAKAEKKREIDAEAAEIDAAIADQKPSNWLRHYNSTPWKPWSTSHVSSNHPARTRLEAECKRRNELARVAWQHSLSQMGNEELLGQVNYQSEQHLPDELLQRVQQIKADRDAAAEEAATKEAAIKEAEIREKLTSAPAHVLERYNAGFLPDDELQTQLANVAFGSVDLPLFDELTEDDIEHSDECYAAKPKFTSREYNKPGDTLDAEEWASWSAVHDVLQAAGFEPELRISKGWCQDDNCDANASRLKARITAVVGGISLQREYAVG